jgi:2-polyprenyl-3-methyl-5-hydroxy-6-metoxy-1,4-benzoquinol methylase
MGERASRPENPKALASAYDDWYGQWAHLSRKELDTVLFPYHESALSVVGDAHKGARVIDIGCGDARLTRELVLRGAGEVVAMDISEVALEIAEKVTADVATETSLQHGDIESIPTPGDSFAVAFCCETLEHVLNPIRALSELSRVLTPGGLLVLTTPNYLSLLGLHRLSVRLRGRRYTEGGQPLNNVTMWPRSAWWLWRAGFEVTSMRVYGYHVPRRGREAREVTPSSVLGRALRPFGEQAVFRAVNRG